jgi:hypothetical protein
MASPIPRNAALLIPITTAKPAKAAGRRALRLRMLVRAGTIPSN